MEKNQNQLFTLFPLVVGLSNISRNIEENELSVIDSNANTVMHSISNAQSKDTFILDNPEFLEIKEFCQQSVELYWKEIVKAPNNVKPVITQSWINYSNKGDSHHKHSHPNSMLSGVFYISAHNDTIRFHSPHRSQIEVVPTEYTMLNSQSYGIHVNSGDCIVFPSYMEHDVTEHKEDYTRISIAFNIFPEGLLGNLQSLTHTNVKVVKENV